jgi:two-component system CheB/CheR fusion protein
MRILPYRTLENVIEGAVVSFVEITKQKELQEQLQELARIARKAQDYAENVVDTIHEPLLVLNADLKVVSANSSFYEFFHVAPEEAIGRSLYDLGNNQWNIPELRTLLEEILPQKTSFKGFEVTHDSQAIGRHTMILNARQIPQKTGTDGLILLAIEDVTEP